MAKIHHGKIGNGLTFITCGHQGGLKAKHAMPQICNGKFFALLLATTPEDCCEHCANYVRKEFPNAVKNAAANPEEYAKKHGF